MNKIKMSNRNIKIELELPEFDKELNISITLKKDGEVLIDSPYSPLGKNEEVIPDSPSVWKQTPEEPKKKSPSRSTKKKTGGNMMDYCD